MFTFVVRFMTRTGFLLKNVLLWAMNINSIEKKVKLKYFQNGDDCNRKEENSSVKTYKIKRLRTSF